MIQTTYIARYCDGLLLCEQTDDLSKTNVDIKRKVKEYLKKVNDTQFPENQFKDHQIENYILAQKHENGIIYMVLVDNQYPLKLAHMYIDEIQNGFIDELGKKFGTSGVDYYSKVQTIDDAYAFMNFDRFIKKKKQEFQDIRSNSNIERLKNDLYKLHDTMTENINLILDRDNQLNQMGDKASNLKKNTHLYKDRTEKLKWQMWLRANMIYFIVGGLLLLFLIFKFVF